MIKLDQVVWHPPDNSGDDTVPPGITDGFWCHMISDFSFDELSAFLADNFVTIGCDPGNIRTPAVGSNVTYVGLNSDQRDAAIALGALPERQTYCIGHTFDAQDPPGLYEPFLR